MKSEHRHELQTNELADWIGHLPEFFREKARIIIALVLIGAGILTWVYSAKRRQGRVFQQMVEATNQIERVGMNKRRAVGGSEGGDASDTLLVSANSLEMAAGEADKSNIPELAALALIKRGEALRADLHYHDTEVQMEIVRSQIEQARKAYEKALERCRDNSTLQAMAEFGLGLCAEELGEYEKAAEIYEQIAAEPDFEGTVFPVRANARLEGMDDSRVEFVVVKAPEPEVELAPLENNETQNVIPDVDTDREDTDAVEPISDEGSVEPASSESETK